MFSSFLSLRAVSLRSCFYFSFINRSSSIWVYVLSFFTLRGLFLGLVSSVFVLDFSKWLLLRLFDFILGSRVSLSLLSISAVAFFFGRKIFLTNSPYLSRFSNCYFFICSCSSYYSLFFLLSYSIFYSHIFFSYLCVFSLRYFCADFFF